MGVFDRLVNVGRGWVSSKRSAARDADLVGTAEEKIRRAREALARAGAESTELDSEEDRLRRATRDEVDAARPSPTAEGPAAEPSTDGTPPDKGDRPLAPERDEDGRIIKRL